MWVMKAMLMVDAMPGSDDDAKAQRKALVKDINAALDALDRLIKLSSSAGPEQGPQEHAQ